MEESTPGLRHGNQETIECWDDDGDLQCTDDFQFRTASTATSLTSSSVRRSGHRDSISSRRSARSDLDSNVGGDEDWQVLLQDNDEVTEEAIASAKSAGIPIPANVPKSALLGGTIKRLGRRKIKKAVIDDWSEDLELPANGGELALKTNGEITFPDALRQVSSNLASPVKSHTSALLGDADLSPQSKAVLPNLEKFRDSNDGADLEDLSTIKFAKSQSRSLQEAISLSSPQRTNDDNEDFEKDFELPADNAPLRLSTRKDFPRTSSPNADDFDTELSEGSIGVRFGGTTRDGRSNRSSSVSGVSPSVSSCLTGESEDDGLDGLVLPDGPLNLEESLRKRQEALRAEAANRSKEAQTAKRLSGEDDFFSDIEIGDGDVFNSTKLALNQNIKRKEARPASPARRYATTITFTNKAVSPKSRLPRLSGHDRAQSTHLEPVSESGAPLSKFRRPQSRVGGHSSHLSLPNIPISNASHTPSTPSTPNRRALGRRASREALRSEHSTTSTQFPKTKRSVPVIQSVSAPGPIPSSQRPPSRQEGTGRRPKTPVDRTSNSRLNPNRRPQVPFLPAGASQSQSHHASVKNLRHFRRNDSDGSSEVVSTQRSMSQVSGSNRPDSPGRCSSSELSPETLAAAAKRAITRPTRRRNFGDGTELESFDDLPTSASAESKFMKHPVGRGAPRSLRNRLSQSQAAPSSRTETPIPPTTPVSSSKSQDFIPRFARDTNASRNARQQRNASTTISAKEREGCPLAPVNANWKAQARAHGAGNSASVKGKKAKTAGTPGARPQLIRPMGTGVHEAKCKLMLPSLCIPSSAHLS